VKPAIKFLKSKYLWMAIYVLCLGLGFWYVSSVLKTGTINVSEEQEKKKAIEIKPVKVSLTVEMPQSTVSYKAQKTNTDSVLDLLNTLRQTTNFRYQKTGYIDRTEIDFVNSVYPEQGYKWKIFSKDQDITHTFQDTYLEDKASYTIRLVKE
jgi:hypothetical protein